MSEHTEKPWPWGQRKVVECGCGRSYDLEAFRHLELAGTQEFDDDPPRLEMRQCACGSTRAIWTDRTGRPMTTTVRTSPDSSECVWDAEAERWSVCDGRRCNCGTVTP